LFGLVNQPVYGVSTDVADCRESEITGSPLLSASLNYLSCGISSRSVFFPEIAYVLSVWCRPRQSDLRASWHERIPGFGTPALLLGTVSSSDLRSMRRGRNSKSLSNNFALLSEREEQVFCFQYSKYRVSEVTFILENSRCETLGFVQTFPNP
jgi:hypothetical protein